jgi:hypothetical protein
MFDSDVDIDLADRQQLLNLIEHTSAAIYKENSKDKHKVGIYVQDIPKDPVLNIANIDYKESYKYGFYKIDLLNVSMYNGIESEEDINAYLNKEPSWNLLEIPDFVNQLFHISNYYKLLQDLKPHSVEKLAAFLALIRPAKKHLITKDWDTILSEVWIKPNDDEYYFKKSHATSYALAIIVQMNKIEHELLNFSN